MGNRALVVGAGIGGLAAAVALVRSDLDVLVLERSAAVREVGAGVLLWPNAIRALRLLGLGDAVEVEGVTANAAAVRTWRGRLLETSVVEQFPHRFGAPLVVVHRAQLQNALLASLGSHVLRVDAECVAVEQTESRASVRLADGRTEAGVLVIGADGLHSHVRTALVVERPPWYSGFTAWRAVVPLDPMLSERVREGQSLGRGSLFGTAMLGGSQAYWWASARIGESPGGDPQAERSSLLHRFRAWHDPIPELIAATPPASIVRTCLHERAPLRRLSLGRIALLGDAAHPMLPSLGQGACQSLEDATALAFALAQTHDVVAALAAYSHRRTRRSADVITASRRAARLAHLRNPLTAGVRNAAMRAAPASASLRRLAPLVDVVIEP